MDRVRHLKGSCSSGTFEVLYARHGQSQCMRKHCCAVGGANELHFWHSLLQTVSDYQQVFQMAYAKVLDIPESQVNIPQVSCGGSVLSGSNNTSSGSSSRAPKPTRHRALLQSMAAVQIAAEASAAASRLLLRKAAKQAKAPPAVVNTIFEVPAPSDPVKRQQVMDIIKQSSAQVLGPAMTILFEHPVEIEPPVLLSAPGLKQQPAASPEPQAEPDPEPEWEEEVEAGFDEVPIPSPAPSPTPAVNETAEVNVTAPSPSPEVNVTEAVNETEVEPPEVPAVVNATAPANVSLPQSPAPGNVSGRPPLPPLPPAPPEEAIVVSPVPVFMPPAPPAPKWPSMKRPPQQENWKEAPSCNFEPTSANSVPDKQGRLWGYIGGTSCAFKSVSGKAAVTVSWDTAADCTGIATTSNSVYDSNNRLWGWQDNRSCAFRGAKVQAPGVPGQELVTWETAPNCKGIPWGSNAVRGADGMLWGYENGKSCAFRAPGANPSVTWAAAPTCVGAPHYYKPVRDSFGRLWGWENGRSCRF